MDVPHFIDYMIINLYGANADCRTTTGTPRGSESPEGSGSSSAGTPSESWSRSLPIARRSQQLEFGGNHLRSLARQRRVQTSLRRPSPAPLFSHGCDDREPRGQRWAKRRAELDRAVVSESARWGDYRRDVHSSSNGPYEFYRRSSHCTRSTTDWRRATYRSDRGSFSTSFAPSDFTPPSRLPFWDAMEVRSR